jgi:hypothetical protein
LPLARFAAVAVEEPGAKIALRRQVFTGFRIGPVQNLLVRSEHRRDARGDLRRVLPPRVTCGRRCAVRERQRDQFRRFEIDGVVKRGAAVADVAKGRVLLLVGTRAAFE